MKRKILPFLALPLLLGSLCSCSGGGEPTQVHLYQGTLIGMDEATPISARSHVKEIKRSKLNSLVDTKMNFVLLLHGSADTCTCYTDWHDNILVPYVKRNKILVYLIDLEEFESESGYLGLERVSGADTLAIFREGKVAYQHSTKDTSNPFVTTYSYFSEWMEKRTQNPSLFYVDEEILDSYYAGDTPFTVCFGRDTCGDCLYMKHNDIYPYMDEYNVIDPYLYFDFDPFRGTDYYKELKAKYGLIRSEDSLAGYGEGVFPTLYHINPDGEHFYGDVIEAAGVFYNENTRNGVIEQSYFTQDRYNEAARTYLTYLTDSNVTNKVIEGLTVDATMDRHEALHPFEAPIIRAFFDYAIGPGK